MALKIFTSITFTFLSLTNISLYSMNSNEKEIQIVSSSRTIFHMPASSVQTIMPPLYELYVDQSWESISFENHEKDQKNEEDIKNLLTEDNLHKLCLVATQQNSKLKAAEIYNLFKMAEYLGSPSLISKRLVYWWKKLPLRKQQKYPIQHHPSYSYSIKELMAENFFPINDLIQNDTIKRGKGYSSTYVTLNLANFNIGQLKGLTTLRKHLDLRTREITKLALNNNHLSELNLDEILTTFPYITVITANNNSIEKVIKKEYFNDRFHNSIRLDLSNNKLTSLPTPYFFFPTIELRDNPLCARARYQARFLKKYNVWRELIFRSGILLGFILATKTASQFLFKNLSDFNVFSPNTLETISSCAAKFPYKTLACINLLFLNPCRYLNTYQTIELNKNESYLHSLEELLVEFSDRGYDFITSPYQILHDSNFLEQYFGKLD